MLTSGFTTVQTIGPCASASALFPSGHDRLIYGECLATMQALPAGSFDLIYIDPPFFTGSERRLQYNQQRGPSYDDTWEHGLQDYLDWLEARLAVMRELLQPHGALLVHLDWHAVHYVKVMLDRLFGSRHFQNEFIWHYSGGGASRIRFARKHDTILYYTRSATAWTFHADRVREPYKWTDGQPRADGSARDLTRGKLPDDVWVHHALLPWAQESQGYPTQKPLELLTRLLLATTDTGDAVGDFFCGAGTTAAAAQRLGRRWVSVDDSRAAICLAAERLAEQLAPHCRPAPGQRARAQAQARYERILADAGRVGLTETTLATVALSLPGATGFSVERWITGASDSLV